MNSALRPKPCFERFSRATSSSWGQYIQGLGAISCTGSRLHRRSGRSGLIGFGVQGSRDLGFKIYDYETSSSSEFDCRDTHQGMACDCIATTFTAEKCQQRSTRSQRQEILLVTPLDATITLSADLYPGRIGVIRVEENLGFKGEAV